MYPYPYPPRVTPTHVLHYLRTLGMPTQTSTHSTREPKDEAPAVLSFNQHWRPSFTTTAAAMASLCARGHPMDVLVHVLRFSHLPHPPAHRRRYPRPRDRADRLATPPDAEPAPRRTDRGRDRREGVYDHALAARAQADEVRHAALSGVRPYEVSRARHTPGQGGHAPLARGLPAQEGRLRVCAFLGGARRSRCC